MKGLYPDFRFLLCVLIVSKASILDFHFFKHILHFE